MDTLLVVGHLEVLDDTLTHSLESSGLSLIGTQDPDEAMSICLDAQPALIFVEVDSPCCDRFELLPKLRTSMRASGRIVAICNRYTDALDDYCENLGANFALPQVDGRTDFNVFVRGLMTLIPRVPGDVDYIACA